MTGFPFDVGWAIAVAFTETLLGPVAHRIVSKLALLLVNRFPPSLRADSPMSICC